MKTGGQKVAFIITSLKGGGAERIASLLVNKFAQEREIFLVFTDSAEIHYDLPENVRIKKISGNFNRGYFLNILLLPVYGYRFKRFLKKNRINTVMSFLGRPNMISCLAVFFGFKGRLVISERMNVLKWYVPGTLMGRMGRFLYEHLYPKADFIVPNSKLTAYNMQEVWHVHGHYCVINNPLNIRLIQNEKINRVELPGAPGAFKCIMTGRFDYPKDQSSLIEMMTLIDDPQVELILVGQGPNMPQLKQKVESAKLENRVFFIDFDPSPFKYLYSADVFVFSSGFEGFPNVLTEAMACGLPAISCDCQSGPREILAPDTDFKKINTDTVEYGKYGVLVPTGNAAKFAEAVQFLKANPPAREKYARLSVERAADFESEKMIAEFSKLLFE